LRPALDAKVSMKSVILVAVVTVAAITLRRTSLKTLKKGDAVRVDSGACGNLDGDPGQAVVDDQVRLCFWPVTLTAGP
jgi:hypothetical protein